MSFTVKLIELVKQNPILYDLDHWDYKDFRKRDKTWDELGLEMNKSGPELKKRWRNLRDTYGKYLRSTESKSGHPKKAKKDYRGWQWAKLMETFKPYMSVAKTDFKVEEVDDQTDNSQSIQLSDTPLDIPLSPKSEPVADGKGDDWAELQTSLQSSTSTSSRSRKQSNIKIKRGHHSTGDSIPDYFQSQNQITSLSPTEMIFLGYAHTIQTFSARRQAITKGKIAQIIMEQELLNEEEQPSSYGQTSGQPHSRASSSASSYGNAPVSFPPRYINVSMDSQLENIDYQET